MRNQPLPGLGCSSTPADAGAGCDRQGWIGWSCRVGMGAAGGMGAAPAPRIVSVPMEGSWQLFRCHSRLLLRCPGKALRCF